MKKKLLTNNMFSKNIDQTYVSNYYLKTENLLYDNSMFV